MKGKLIIFDDEDSMGTHPLNESKIRRVPLSNKDNILKSLNVKRGDIIRLHDDGAMHVDIVVASYIVLPKEYYIRCYVRG